MATEHDADALEALAREEPVADRAGLDAHLAACDDCARELAWLRAERRLLRGREVDAPPLDRLWDGVAARLPPAAATASPYRTAAPPPAAPARRPWGAFAAGFAAAVALGAGVAALTLKVNTRPPRPDAPRVARAEEALPVEGPVRLRVETWSADVRVAARAGQEIRAVVRGLTVAPRITRHADGGYFLAFHGRRLEGGAVDVIVPSGSSLEVTTASGDVSVGGEVGAVRLTSTSGDVRATAAGDAEVTTTSGDVTLTAGGARVRVRSVSGSARVVQRAAAPEAELETASGDLEWSGGCGRGCRLGARSVSGDVRLTLGPASDFSLRFTTASGELADAIGTGAAIPEGGGPATGRRGAGDGAIEVTTTSGALALAAGGGR